jgi:hypothetical protein
MPELFKPGRHGFRQYQLADGFPVVTIDVVAADAEWCEAVKPLWDSAEDDPKTGKKTGLHGGALMEYHRLALDFASRIYQVPEGTPVSLAEAMQLIARVAKDAKEEVSFFSPPKEGAGAGDSSLPESMPDSLRESLMPAPGSGT